jgi:hypothetical protein
VEVTGGSGPPLPDSFRQFGGQDRIYFDGDDGLRGVQQPQRQGPKAGPDFQDSFLRPDARHGHNPADGVAVDHEVLAQGLGGTYTDFLGQPADI